MDWMRRKGRPEPPAEPAPGDASPPAATEGAAPGVAALFEGVSEDRTHSVLDLGQAADRSLRVYSRFARWVHFADMISDSCWPSAHGSTGVSPDALPAQPQHPYDIIFAWDILDRLLPWGRPPMMQGLAALTAPGARLHIVVRAADDTALGPLRFTLLDTDRIRYEPAGTERLPRPGLLPAEVKTVLEPFRVQRAFTLRSGLREYVAVRSE
jgi:hypothetical protein